MLLNHIAERIRLMPEVTVTGGGEGGDEHAYVDLGLPSGLLWATCNVGADNPEEYGDYFAWGETVPKDTYNADTYQYYIAGFTVHGSPYHYLTKYCPDAHSGYNGYTDDLTTLESSDDAATANWGNGWRMPTREEFYELCDNTTVTMATQNGVNGKLFTATNGNSLFLPAAGGHVNGLVGVGNYGDYWSSSLGGIHTAYYFYFQWDWDAYGMDFDSRYFGFPVRPVREN